ncbi:MAG TPA: type II toxin-antitoxin system RelE/ParE family toxin [Cyclobacteriaceae bacterium]|nr:type II toxin-antitoxin system RelE/ParE family toxin [Cyclobacteriaceae bacterium]
MALALVWTKRAIQGYDKIVHYLEEHWTDKEVRNFIHESEEFFTLLSEYPEVLQKTSRYNNVYRGPMNKLTVITYRVKPRKKQIELINIRAARQRPLK